MLVGKGGARVAVAVLALGVVVAGLIALVGSRAAGPSGTGGAIAPAVAPAVEQSVARGDDDGPRPADAGSGPEGSEGPEEVLAGVYVANIQSVNLSTNSFDADFYVWLRWRDPDLDPTVGMEVVNSYMSWGLMETPVYDEPQPQPDGSLLWQVHFQGSFNAPLSLSDYPFERQTLRIIIEDNVDTTQRVVYRPDTGPVALDPEVTLPGYHIGQPQIAFGDFTYGSSFGEVGSTSEDRTYPRITVTIPLASPAASGIAKTLLPIFIVLVAASLTLVIPVGYVDAKIGLAITALLALVAMHWGVSSSLPDAGYLLMIDVLYLIAYAAVTAVLAVTITGVRMTATQGEQAVAAMERRMRVVIGGAVLLALAAVLLFYLPEGLFG